MTQTRHRTGRMLAGAAVLLFALALAACGGDEKVAGTLSSTAQPAAAATNIPTTPLPTASSTITTPAATAQQAVSPAATDDAAMLEATALRLLDALQHHDRDRLHNLTGHHLRDHLHEQDLDHLASCMPDHTTVRIADQRVEIDGDVGKVIVTLELTDAHGAPSTIERTWSFARDTDGTWKLFELPACPIH